MGPKGVLALSGGMDSTTLLSHMLHLGYDVYPVLFQYGSKHNYYEEKAVSDIVAFFDLESKLKVIDISSAMKAFKSNLLKSGGEIPEGHYQQENMTQTVVPGRNLIFASILTGYAWSIGGNSIWMGIHSGDHVIYPDCRPEFAFHMDFAVRHGSDHRIRLQTPFLHECKTTIIKQGLKMGTPYVLTRTCYKDQPISCGRCGSCQERLEAFKENDIEDPIQYESRELLAKE